MAQRARGRRGRKNAAAKRRALLIGAIVCAVVLMAFLAAYFVMRSAVNKTSANVIWDNIYIETVDLSGMNAKEAKAALTEFGEDYKEKKVKLIVEEAEAEVTLGELGFQLKNTDALLKEAMAYGKDGSVFTRYQKMKELQDNPIKLEATYSVDSKLIKEIIAEKFSELEGAAVDATIKRENGQFVITDGKAGIKVDIEKSMQTIEAHFNETWEYKGVEELQLVTTVDEPDVTREQLSQIQSVLGTFSTSFTRGSNRGKNIAHAANLMNGIVLLPGEEMSASDSMGSRTAENGYLEAGAYLNGQTVQSYGGGVCQVSSTLYNAVLLAELEVVQRFPHSMLVDYVKPAMDAAIAEGSKDLKIKNNTGAPIFIEAYTVGGKLTFTIYGKETRSANRTITYEHEVLSTTTPAKKFVESGDAIGTIKKKVSPHTGMKTKLWKIVKENGVQVSKDLVNSSNYSASAGTYSVGTATDNAQAKALVANAIKSQNEATINAAIAQAKALIEAAKQPTQSTQPTEPGTPEPTTP